MMSAVAAFGKLISSRDGRAHLDLLGVPPRANIVVAEWDASIESTMDRAMSFDASTPVWIAAYEGTDSWALVAVTPGNPADADYWEVSVRSPIGMLVEGLRDSGQRLVHVRLTSWTAAEARLVDEGDVLPVG